MFANHIADENQGLVEEEIFLLLEKKAIVPSSHEHDEFVPPIFLRR